MPGVPHHRMLRTRAVIIAVVAMLVGLLAAAAGAAPVCTAANRVTAQVVALDQPFWLNRLGAAQPGGMIFALARDVVPKPGAPASLQPGQVELRGGKRPRPLVLRANVGQCLEIVFTNLLAPESPTPQAGVHVMGMPLLGSTRSDGSWVGENATSLIAPSPAPITYRLFAEAEGTFLLYSTADDFSNGLGGQLTAGLFGAVNIQPRGAQWFRSQVSRHDLDLATRKGRDGKPLTTPAGQPLLDYDALYPAGERWPDGTPIPAGTPILRMLDQRREIVHGDLTALIAGPTHNGYDFPVAADPGLRSNPVEPNRRQPYRELTILYHEIFTAVQAFPDFNQGTNPPDPSKIGSTLGNGGEAFAINYGTAGIGAEILANRLGVGPMGRCVDCKFEEFFLSSWTAGDPAMVVDVPANNPCTTAQIDSGTPCLGPQDEGKRVPPTGTPFRIEPVAKATRALYPDDPSNVYHSYLNDHVKFRVLHAGSFIAHVHHLHAHQWLHTPNSAESTYLDSQMITPGTSYTMEIAFGGSGNLNKTAGDSIFHCHFYPHFAGGMWSLWRVHDVFEAGTQLADGRPVPGSRALPDGEMASGSPIPAVVPIPSLPMAPIPARISIVAEQDPAGSGRVVGYRAEVDAQDLAARKSPGYPFFVPGVAGHRAPHPPLDFAPNLDYHAGEAKSRQYLDGGLARHVILDGDLANEHHNQWDFSKDTDAIVARELPEGGTPVERVAMAAHSTPKPWIPSYTQGGKRGFFEVNGLPAASGAPFANPGRDLEGNAVGEVRRYKAADLQTDVVFSKKGWHYPQERHIALWEDVAPSVSGARAPEPLFFRANSETDVIEYWMTNLVPGYYELDDFQVRTPTDILGQHIHLVKFDVLASDGAANGFNYEDGSLSPDEVRDRIRGIRKYDHCQPVDPRDGTFACPLVQAAPQVFGAPPPGQDWSGAQTTIQRWYADPIFARSCKGGGGCDDRTLRTVFTHDHFSPSTHQQAGLYGGLLVEPRGSTWKIPAIVTYGADGRTKVAADNVSMGTRDDGGPTSWQADILTRDPGQSYREFGLEFQDTALAYNAKSPSRAVPYPPGGVYPTTTAGLIPPNAKPWGWADCPDAVNPINNSGGAPCTTPQNDYAAWPAIITGGPGTGSAVTNYRTEPLPLRVAPGAAAPASCQPPAGGESADLSHVYRSICRQDGELDRQPRGPFADPHSAGCDGASSCYPGGFLGADEFDPYTPLLRAYQGDRVQIRLLAGAHVSPHSFTTEGLRWLFEPSYRNSGWVATQSMGLSEHFEAEIYDLPRSAASETGFADYLYVTGAGQSDLVQGLWGLLRAYDGRTVEAGLPRLPGNERPAAKPPLPDCPPGARRERLAVTAVTAAKALATGAPGSAGGGGAGGAGSGMVAGSVAYNARGGAGGAPPIEQPDALLYVRSGDLDADGRLKAGTPVEPLVLHAAAGDCVEVTLTNGLDPGQKDKNGFAIFTTPLPQPMGDQGDTVNLLTSSEVGLRPQLVQFDVTRNAAFNVGHNPVQTVKPGHSRTFRWYAGIAGKAAELGSVNLLPSDPLMQDPLGLLGALVVEPAGAVVREDANSRAAARVRGRDGASFRDFVLFTQSDLQSIQPGTGSSPAVYGAGLYWGSPTSGLSTANAVSYRTEPLAYRLGSTSGDVANVLSDGAVSADPQTPIFVAAQGQAARFRLAQVSGTGDAENLTIHGHVWQEEPWRNGSTALGSNPLSEWFGTAPHGPEDNGNLLLGPAGGRGGVTGDYLYRSFLAQGNFSGGEWGLFRVLAPGRDSVSAATFGPCAGAPASTCLTGTNTVNPETGRFAAKPNVIYAGAGREGGEPAGEGSVGGQPAGEGSVGGQPAGEGSAGGKLGGLVRLGEAMVDPQTGAWSFRFTGPVPAVVTVVSAFGASSVATTAPPTLVEVGRRRPLAATPAAEAKLRRARSFLRHPLGEGGAAGTPAPPKAPAPGAATPPTAPPAAAAAPPAAPMGAASPPAAAVVPPRS